jgi:hypothetical protein
LRTILPDMTNHFYTIDDFQKLSFLENQYTLPQSVLDIFKFVESNLEITEPTPAVASLPSFSGKSFVKKSGAGSSFNARHNHSSSEGDDTNGRKPQDRYRNVRNDKKSSISSSGSSKPTPKITDDDWEMMRNFKTTKIATKTGIEKVWSDIRVALNKMSASTYDKITQQVFGFLAEYFAGDLCNETNTQTLTTNIITLCCSNKIYVELFSHFYLEACEKHDCFREAISPFVEETFTQTVPAYVDSDVDYDAYCVYNKQIDARKNKNLFIVQLTKRGLVEETKLLDMVSWYMDEIMTNIIKDGRAKEIEDMTENLFLLVSGNTSHFTSHEMWNDKIVPAIETLGKSTNKSYPSISNRIVFKFIDIIDAL